MAKLTLNNVERLDRLSALNDNFEKIEDKINNDVLSSDGSDELKGNLNANGKRVYNLPDPVDNQDAATVKYVLETATGVEIDSGVTSVEGKTGAVTLDKTDVDLGNVDNTSDSNKPVSTAQQNALDLKADNNDVVISVANKQGDVTLTKGDVSLGNVNNTADLDKPVSTDQQNAIDASAENVYFEGWEYIAHGGAAQTIDTAYSDLVIDGEGSTPTASNNTYLPNGVTALWDTTNNLITPEKEGDCYVLRIGVDITGDSGTPTKLTAALEIPSSPAVIVYEASQSVEKNAPYQIDFTIPVFTLDRFVADGATIKLKTDTGSVTIENANLFIQRTFSPITI